MPFELKAGENLDNLEPINIGLLEQNFENNMYPNKIVAKKNRIELTFDHAEEENGYYMAQRIIQQIGLPRADANRFMSYEEVTAELRELMQMPNAMGGRRRLGRRRRQTQRRNISRKNRRSMRSRKY
ncbi:MAG: hypothetical protein EBT86_00085 [Actinobacteria bacterium]|nr:hypothetical protein [Actinomycetota bacterium]